MKNDYDPYQPIETLFNQIEIVVDYYSADKSPYDSTQGISRTYLPVLVCKG